MKRILIPGLMLAAAFALTNCSEQIVPPVQEGDSIVEEKVETSQVEEVPFEVFAQSEEVETKTYATGSKGYLEWEATDELNVFHSQAGKNSYSKHGKFVVDANNNGAQRGLFIGNLILSDKVQLHENNDWFFLYPYSSGDTPTVTIGSTTANVQANSKAHIYGANYPMFGEVHNVPKAKNPATSMKHLSALVAVKVVNEGYGGNIMVKDVEFSIPEILNASGTVTQAAFPLVGQFQVAADKTITAVEGQTSNSVKVTLPSAVTLANGESVTLYLAVRPFAAKGKTISIKVNGSERTVKITKDVNLESGKVTTFSVPVKALVAKDVLVENGIVKSDAFTITSIGRQASEGNTHTTGNTGDIVITTSTTPKTIKVNGQDVDAYVLGSTNGQTGTITITGFLPDLINALPVKFYVSTWNDAPAVMTVNKVTAWIPKYDADETYIKQIRKELLYRYEEWDVVTDFGTITKRAGAQSALASGVMGSDKAQIQRWMLLMFGDGVESKITFSNISKNGYFDSNNNIVILNEGFTQKEVNDSNLDTFLKSFTTGSGANKKTATAAGLRKIANAEFKDLPNTCAHKEERKVGRATETTAHATPIEVSTDWPVNDAGECIVDEDIVNTVEAIWGRISGIDIGSLVKATHEIPTKFHLLHMLRDVKVSVELSTTSNGPCIVFWGFDANTPEDRDAAASGSKE